MKKIITLAALLALAGCSSGRNITVSQTPGAGVNGPMTFEETVERNHALLDDGWHPGFLLSQQPLRFQRPTLPECSGGGGRCNPVH